MKLSFPIFHKKDLVITIHGFGHKTEREMEPLAAYLEKAGFEVWNFSYYDPDDLSDTDFRHWIARCEVRLRKAVDEHRTIHLLGFSMGGVIASYLASVYPVRDLLLAAPAFYPLDFSKFEKAAVSKITSSGSSQAMSSDQTKAFMTIVSRYRSSVLSVSCPILILHGSADEVIQPKSSRRIFSMIPSPRKYLVFLEGARHRFLYDGAYESLAFPMIRDFFRNEIHPQMYPDLKAEKARDREEKKEQKKEGAREVRAANRDARRTASAARKRRSESD